MVGIGQTHTGKTGSFNSTFNTKSRAELRKISSKFLIKAYQHIFWKLQSVEVLKVSTPCMVSFNYSFFLHFFLPLTFLVRLKKQKSMCLSFQNTICEDKKYHHMFRSCGALKQFYLPVYFFSIIELTLQAEFFNRDQNRIFYH